MTINSMAKKLQTPPTKPKSAAKKVKPVKINKTRPSKAEKRLFAGYLLFRSRRGIRLSARMSRLLAGLTVLLLLVASFFVGLSMQQKKVPAKALPTQNYSAEQHSKLIRRPQKLALLPNVPLMPLGACPNGTTDVVVAHEDDDLLFMNMDLANEITSGKCLRSIYMTAGDDGHSRGYWGERENGIQRAYAFMAGANNNWTEEAVTVYGHLVSVRHLVEKPNIGLVFVRLPDGNLNGRGFANTAFASLEELAVGKINRISTVDSSTDYSYTELKALVGAFLRVDAPDDIFTHVADGSDSEGDHTDHRHVGQLVQEVRDIVRPDSRLIRFVGYPSGHMPENISQELAVQKREIFLNYAQHDSLICNAQYSCFGESTYANYYYRQYKH